MPEAEPSDEYERPPIVVEHRNIGTRAEVDARIIPYRDKKLSHHSYDIEVIRGWEKLIGILGADAPIAVAALGLSLHRHSIEDEEQAPIKFIEELIESYSNYEGERPLEEFELQNLS